MSFVFAPDTGAGNAGGSPEPEKVVTLSQEKLNEIIDDAYARAFKKAKGELEEKELNPLRQQLEITQAELKRLQEELQKAAKKDTPAQPPESGDTGNDVIPKAQLEEILAKKEEEFKSLLTQRENELQQRQKMIEMLLAERKRQALEVAASKAGAIEPAIVAKLLGDYVAEDEQLALYIKSEKGGKRLTEKGDPMSIEEFVVEWLNKNPYLLRPEVRAGGGAVPSASRTMTPKTLDDQIREAEQKGDVRTAIRLKQQKLLMTSR
jgi:hypothetical protein